MIFNTESSINLSEESQERINSIINKSIKNVEISASNTIDKIENKLKKIDLKNTNIKLETSISLKFDISNDLWKKIFKCFAPISCLSFIFLVMIILIKHLLK